MNSSPLRALAVCLALLAAVGAGAADPPPRISVISLFGNPIFSQPRLSPDGKSLALIVSRGDVQIVATRTVAGGPIVSLAKFSDPKVRLTSLEWIKPAYLLVGAESLIKRLDGRFDLAYSIEVETGKIAPLGWMPQIVHRLPDEADHVLIRRTWRLFRMRVSTGYDEVAYPRVYLIHTWVPDAAGIPRVGISGTDGNYALWHRKNADETPNKLFAHDDPAGPYFLAYHADPSKLYVVKRHEGRNAVFELEVVSGAIGPALFSDPQFDIDAVVFDGTPERRVVAVQVIDDRAELRFLDPRAAEEHAFVEAELAERLGAGVSFEVESLSHDGRVRVISAASDRVPPNYLLFDRVSRALAPLFQERPALVGVPLAETRALTYQARDGLAIRAYLTIPPGAEAKRLPLIVNPHGGPWARDQIEWNPELQLLAGRGFAVLQMNFRGSTGYGHAFEAAGYRQWGGKIQDDILDGVKWAIAEGVADPDRIGIYGTSFGGYSAFVQAARSPELYRAAAAYAGVSDIFQTVKEDSVSDFSDIHTERTGRYFRDRKLMRENSPIEMVASIRAPILMGHGDEDDSVGVQQSRAMARALREAGKDFDYLEFPHEVHGFVLEANRIRWYEALIAFFEKNLAPREKAAEVAAPAP